MWSSERRWALASLAALATVGSAAVLTLAGCGFQRRAAPTLAFSRIALTGFGARSPLAAELQRSLAESVQIVAAPAQAEVVLQALKEQRDKATVATTTSAQVRELEVRLRFGFRAHTPAGRELVAPVELLLARNLSYTESAALAKEREEAELYNEMQADVVAQVMRRLAAIRL
jgi:LPS-assembly lipoprotein